MTGVVGAGAFLDRLRVEQVHPGRWSTLSPLRYCSAVFGGIITVPAEFVTDFASVPRGPFLYMLAGGRAPGPATVHDYLYQHPHWTDRRLADAIFFEAMGVTDAALGYSADPGFIRWAMWAGIRLGGWLPWRHDKDRANLLNPIWQAEGWPAAVS